MFEIQLMMYQGKLWQFNFLLIIPVEGEIMYTFRWLEAKTLHLHFLP